jgi:acetyl esterase/lipase
VKRKKFANREQTTGSPWDPAWKSQALIDLIETRPIVYITFDRRRLPECNGEDILNDIHDAMAYLFDQDGIETLVKAHYPSLGWCRHKLVLTGESAGGFLALHIYLKWGQRISGVYLRYPLLHEYRRDFGPYMEREVVFKKAAISLFRLFSLLNVLYDLPPAAGRFPSDGMWPAYKTSCFTVWGRLWNASYPIDLLREKSLNTTTEFLVLHGTSDVQVPIASSRSFVRSMQERGIRIVLKEVSSAAHGFDYDISLLNSNMESLGQMMDRLGM